MNEDPTIPLSRLERSEPALETPAVTASWGSFTLLARVGSGGFGEVYRAWDPHLQREVALKLLLPRAVGSEAEYETMLREARALASVRHLNIVPVYGIDRHDGRVGFWTDFVRGKTLSALVHEQGTFGAHEAALIGLDVVRALSAVHRAGLLHRDIKAENVMREEGGRILLMDFGLSALDQRQSNIAGTPNYMAPELFHGHQGTAASDIYALGVLLYFLVAGDYPVYLSGLSAAEAIQELSQRKPLIDLRPDLPEPLLRTISTAMEIDPHKRFASAGQLASALSESLGTHPPAEIPAESQQLPARRSATKWILGGLLSAAVIVGFSLVWYGSASKSNRAPSDEFQKAQEKLLHSYKEANVADAVRGFQAVLQADPKNALAKARLGAAYLVQFQYSHDPKLLDLAKQETNSAMELERDLAAPFITLSRIAAIEGQTDLAMQQAKKALELEPRNAEGFGALGEVYEAEGREKEALDEYRKASDLAPEDWRWPVSLGVAEFGQGKIAESISELQRGIELAPDNAVAYFDLSVAHLQSHDVEAVRGDLEKSIAIEPTARAYSALGSALMYQGKYDNAESMDKKAIELSPDSYEAWEDLGAAYQWSGTKPELAAQAFRKAIDLAERERTKRRMDPALLVTLAEDYAAIGDLPKSMPLARQALALSPDDPTISYRAGETFEALGQREMAISLISKALLNGYHTYEFERNPLLGSLRSDPKFAARMNALIARKK